MHRTIIQPIRDKLATELRVIQVPDESFEIQARTKTEETWRTVMTCGNLKSIRRTFERERDRAREKGAFTEFVERIDPVRS